jgi:hypothetical protein
MSKTPKVSPRFQINKTNVVEFLMALRAWDILGNQEMGKMLEAAQSSQCLPPATLPELAKMQWVKDMGSFHAPKALWLHFLLVKGRTSDTNLLLDLRFSRINECKEAGCLNPLHWRFLQKKPDPADATSVELFLLSIILKNPALCPAEVKEDAQKQLTKIVLSLLNKGVQIDLPALQSALRYSKGEENETRL